MNSKNWTLVRNLFLVSSFVIAAQSSAEAFVDDLNDMVGLQSCSGCHGNANNVFAGTATDPVFTVIDIDTNMAVEEYAPNKEYEIRIRFAPQMPAAATSPGFATTGYGAIAYQLRATDAATSAKPLGRFTAPAGGNDRAAADRGLLAAQDSMIVRHLRSATPVQIGTVTQRWRSPAVAAGAISFKLLRMEPNGSWTGVANQGQGAGDRWSLGIESYPLRAPAGTPATVTTGPVAGDSEAIGGSDNLTQTGFDGNLEGGCGLLEAKNKTNFVWPILLMLLVAIFTICLRRQTFKN